MKSLPEFHQTGLSVGNQDGKVLGIGFEYLFRKGE
jgi:hypothetical protein